MSTEPQERRAARSPALATFLSFLWPGLGQLYVGARRAALIFGLPLLVVVVVVGLQAMGGPESLLLQLLTPSTALTVLILVALLGLWRVISMGDALTAAGRHGTWRRPLPIASFVVLTALVVTTHLAMASLAWSFYDAGKDIFVGVTDPDLPRPSASANLLAGATDGSSASPDASASASAAPVDQRRINILLTGIDSDEHRNHALTDTIIVVSIDPDTGDLALVSFPRDLSRFPMPGGKTFNGKINAFMTYANNHPDAYPQGGLAALAAEVGYVLGAPVDYYASVDLEGFRKLIDRVGGVTIDVTTAINDPGYGGWDTPGKVGFKLSVGKHKLNGETALAYVRTRKGAGDSDFSRARRQQQLLVALQKKMTDPAMLPNLPGILQDATKTLKTNFPPDQLSAMLTLARSTDESAVKRYVLGPPYSTHPTNITSVYILVLDMDRLAKLSISLFGDGSRYATAPAK